MTLLRLASVSAQSLLLIIILSPDSVAQREGLPGARSALAAWDALRLDVLRRELAALEYRASDNGRGLQAPNRAHNLRTYFNADGVDIVDRTADGSPELVRIALEGVGRGAAIESVQPGDVEHDGNRIEIRRGGVVEWYENTAAGLEQGFTFATRPAGRGDLVLELSVASATARMAGADIVLESATGREMTFGGLFAIDATGCSLVARMEVAAPDTLRLVVEDAAAVYPIVVDPLLSGLADARVESNQPDPDGFLPAAFGGSVAAAGDVNGDGFGDVLVGAPGWDGGDPHEGAVFVFLGSAAGIVGTGPLNAAAQIESNQFGAQLGTLPGRPVGDVNGDGFDDIVVGAHFYSTTLPGTALEVNGAAFVFYGSAAGITGTSPADADAAIFANELGSDLGQFVSGAGDVNGDGFADIVVGVPDHGTLFPPNIPENQRSGDYGAALIFHGSALGITGTGFGDADAIILPYEDTGQPEPPIFGAIGRAIGAGDVNADGFDDVVVGGTEIALFLGSASGLVGSDLAEAQSRIHPGGPFGFSEFSLDVASAGDVNGDGFADLVAGAPFREAEPFTARQEGAAFVFHGGPLGFSAADTNQADLFLVGELLAEWLGASVAGAGDIDADGFDDIVIAAREYPGSLFSEGVAYLFRGGPQGIVAESVLDADSRLEARQSGAVTLEDNAAFSVAGAGDINGDGFADVIMGKGYYDAGEENEGAAFVYLGGPWPQVPNQPPVAHAGPDQQIFDVDDDGLATATLNGSASFDPDGSIVSFAWLEGETLLGTEPLLTTDLTATGDHTLVLTVTDNAGVTRGDPVTVRVDLVDDVPVLFDGFAAGLSGWVATGDVTLSSADPFPDAPQARLGAGASLSRSIDLPAGSTGMTLQYWGKATQFAASDSVDVSVSVDGGPFTTIQTLTSADSSNSYIFYGGSALPLGHSWYPATASNIVLRFASSTTTGALFVDDVRVSALLAPIQVNANPVADAGPNQSATDLDADGSESFTLIGTGSFDSDGTIVEYRWSVGGVDIAFGSTPFVTLPLGSTTVTLTVTDDGGASASDSVLLTVSLAAGNEPPVANAGLDQVLLDADGNGTETVTLDGSASSDGDGSIATYLWSEGSTVLGTDAVITVALGIGAHTLALTVTDDAGSSDVDTVQITVDAPLTSTAGHLVINGPTAVQRGDNVAWTVTLHNTGGSALTAAQLNFSVNPNRRIRSLSPSGTVNLGSIAVGANASQVFSGRADRQGAATITVTAAGSGESLDVLTLPISITNNAPGNQTPIANAGADQQVVDADASGAETVLLNAAGSSDTDGTIVSFQWREGGALIAAGATASATLAVGVHTVILTVTDDAGASATDSVTIDVAAPPGNVPPTADAGPDQHIVLAEGETQASVVLDGSASFDPDGALAGFEWRQDGVVIGTVPTLSRSFAAGTYTVQLTVFDADGASATDSASVTVSEPVPNQPPIANAGVDQTVSDADENGSEFVVLDARASSDVDGAITSFVWHEGPILLGAGVTLSAEFALGTHTVTLTATDDDGASATDSVIVEVLALPPNQSPVADAGIDRTFVDTDGDTLVVVTLDGSGSFDPDGTIVLYDWRNEFNNPVGNTAVVNFIQSFGVYPLTLTVTDDRGATSTDAVTITVEPGETANLPPVASAGPDQTLTDADGSGSESVVLNGGASSDPDGAIVSYQWSEGTVPLGSGVTLTAELAVGTHTITLTVTDDAGASAVDTLLVTVSPVAAGPEATVAISAPASLNRGDAVSITVTVTNSGASTLTGMQLSLSISPTRRVKDLSPGATVNVADVPPGQTVSQSWSGRTDQAGTATLTAEATSNGISLDVATGTLTITD